jgi:hypothetical protein
MVKKLLGLGSSRAKSVFLSYRRSDSADVAKNLFGLLSKQVRGFHVFRDTDSIPIGVDFVQVIREEVSACDVFVALAGRGWVSASDALGRQRLLDDQDFVRLEVALALKLGLPIVLALVDGADRLCRELLPADIADLASCSCVNVDSHDLQPLIQAIQRAPAAPLRMLSIRERLDRASALALRLSVRWIVLSVALGVVLVPVMNIAFGWEMTQFVVCICTLAVIPLAVGGWTGKKIGGLSMGLLGAILALAVTAILFAMSFFFVYFLSLIIRAMHGQKSHADFDQVTVGAFWYVGALIGAVAGVRLVLRRRASRIRVNNAFVTVLGTAVISAVVFGAIHMLVNRCFPPASWGGLDQILRWTVISWMSLGTLGAATGAAHGWSKRESR